MREGPLGKFLVKNGYYATERELRAIMRRLDVDHDGSVLYSDLSEYIKPRVHGIPTVSREPSVPTEPVMPTAASETKPVILNSSRRKSGSRSASRSKSP